MLGRIALTLHERARFVTAIEIVAELGPDGPQRAAALVRATQQRFALFMDPGQNAKPISLTLRPCACATEAQLLTEANVCPWFEITARIASAEHLLWLWCRSDHLDHHVDASALIGGGAVDLYRVTRLLRETDDDEEAGRTRLRLAIGDAVLASECTFSRYQEEKRKRLKPGYVPIWRRFGKLDGGNPDR